MEDQDNAEETEESEKAISSSKVSVNTDIRDDLISHDIDLQKVSADTRAKVEALINKMETELLNLMLKIDPFTPTATGIREARFKQLEEESAPVIAKWYKEIAKMMRQRGERAVVAESQVIVDTIHDNIPETA